MSRRSAQCVGSRWVAVTAALALIAPPAPASVQRLSTPAPLAEDAPRLAHVRPVVEALVARNAEAAVAGLQRGAAPGSSLAAEAAGKIAQVLEAIGAEGVFDSYASGGDEEILARFARPGAGRLGVLFALYPTSGRIADLRLLAGRRMGGGPDQSAALPDITAMLPPGSTPLARSDERARRVERLVAALNDAERRDAFIAADWRSDATRTEAVSELDSITERTGNGVVLQDVAVASDGNLLAVIRNSRGRRTLVMLDDSDKGRLAIAGFVREPGRILTSEERVPGETVLPSGGVGRAEFFMKENRPHVRLNIEGQGPFIFLLESGCDCFEITPNAAARLADRLEPLTDDELYRVDGQRVHSVYRADQIGLGTALFRNVNLQVTQTLGAIDREVDGIIGLPAFRELLLTIDYPAGEVRMERGNLPEPDDLEVFEIRKANKGKLPFYEIDVSLGGVVVPLIVDTQSPGSIMVSEERAAGLSFAAPPIATGSVLMGGSVTAQRKEARLAGDAVLGRYRFERPLVMAIAHPPERPRSGHIGNILLRHFVVTLDQRNGRLRLSSPGSSVIAAPPPAYSLGLGTRREADGNLRVTSVLENGPAARAGLVVGDLITIVAGRPAAEGPRSLNDLAAAGALRATVLSGDRTREVTLTDPIVVP